MNKKTINNIISLYGFSFTKVLLPLISIPYLTRVLSVDHYGLVAYTRSLIGYFQLFIDFGFVLSGTKKIVRYGENTTEISRIRGGILFAQLIIAVLLIPVLIGCCLLIPIFKGHEIYLIISYIPVVLSVFLFDYIFRGLEKMHILTIRFFVLKGVSTFSIFLVVKGDSDIFWIPMLEVLGSVLAILFVNVQLRNIGVGIVIHGFREAINELKESAIFFVSNVSQALFSCLSTIIIGVFLSSADVAYWSLCIQLVTAAQTMYQPITDGIYPRMVATKDIRIIKRILIIFLPLIGCACICVYYFSRYALIAVGGVRYGVASSALRILIPVMFLGFVCNVFGWPTLGAINRDKEVTISTIIGASFQLIFMITLGLSGRFNLISIAICRSITELVLFIVRFSYFKRYRGEFVP